MGSGFLSVGFHPLGQVCHQFQLVVAETDHVWLQVSQSSVVRWLLVAQNYPAYPLLLG